MLTKQTFVSLNINYLNMVEKLLTMKIGETKEFNRIEYDTVISTKSRLKRQQRGQWQSELSKDGFFIKRTA